MRTLTEWLRLFLLALALPFMVGMTGCNPDDLIGSIGDDSGVFTGGDDHDDDGHDDDGDGSDDDIEAEGPIQALGSSSLTVEGRTFFVTNNTEYDDGLDGFYDLRIGMYVEVEGYYRNGRLYAEEIERDDHDDDDDDDDGD